MAGVPFQHAEEYEDEHLHLSFEFHTPAFLEISPIGMVYPALRYFAAGSIASSDSRVAMSFP
jgi:hypothetical protein